MRFELKLAVTLLYLLSAVSCGGGEEKADAYGNFEAVETVVSAETSGRVLSVFIEEGEYLAEGAVAAVVDTTSFSIRRRELKASLAAAGDEIAGLDAEIDGKHERVGNLEREWKRISGMYSDSAATERELDAVRTELEAMRDAVRSMERRRSGLAHNREVIGARIDLVNDSINRSVILNPISGTVLEKYRYRGELVMPGTALYRVQDLSELDLRAYISGSQLSSVQAGDSVDVFIDISGDEMKKLGGKVSWISETAEFTPKIIQTRDVRVDLVYAVRIKVRNGGELKIGMPAEVRFRD
ncbi:MAG: HlyD family efflux transporter periplasmic adaptor subunit [Candidatus Latescibacteria bacterium]|nr:HlyD family efflux transporter periplasmic adaptor subunit [bacterium]MBD3424022.1 HlyD family efflux transporter periplasmic adaptor subunit [Candidatus Latescibacterota bacterium]